MLHEHQVEKATWIVQAVGRSDVKTLQRLLKKRFRIPPNQLKKRQKLPENSFWYNYPPNIVQIPPFTKAQCLYFCPKYLTIFSKLIV
ncbi:hypothetical protein B6N25_06835 [Sphingobacteriales bacterium TSM_CSS]|nr:hypothetical protein B6N25_06835 [Sphingobacteriales bacterium TSM_CSS]